MAVAQLLVKSVLGENLRKARRAADLTQEQAAQRLGVTKQTISDQERGVTTPNEKNLLALAELYQTTPGSLRYGEPNQSPETVREGVDVAYMRSGFTPSTALRKRLPPKPYARVFEHIARMENAGCSIEQIEEAERLMIDSAFNKLNAPDSRERSDKEMIVDIDGAWAWIKERLAAGGAKGLDSQNDVRMK